MKPAARVSDMHVCPMLTPGVVPIPHVGGPVLPPGAPTVLIGNLPAATVGGQCLCVGPPDAILMGSATVLIRAQVTAGGGARVVNTATVSSPNHDPAPGNNAASVTVNVKGKPSR